MAERPCPVCACEYFEVIYVTPTMQVIAACSDCGMVYARESAPVDYAGSSIYTCSSTYSAQEEHYREIVRRSYRSHDTVIDVGVALGGLLKAFLERGATDVRGISVSQGEVDHCVALGLNAEIGDIAKPTRKATLVTVSHVLEHVPDVHGFLSDLRRWVAPGGLVYIEVPDVMRYTHFFTGICQGFNSEHVNHFSSSHLRDACARAGFDCVDRGSYEANGYPVIYVRAEVRLQYDAKTAVQSYAKLLDSQVARVKEHLAKEIAGISRVALWGCGQTAHMLIAAGVIGENVILATDTNPAFHGKPLASTWVVEPEVFHPPDGVPIFVCSQMNRDVIAERIKELGLTNPIISLEPQ